MTPAVEIEGLTRDFGNFRNGRITGTKIHDTNCNGTLGDNPDPEDPEVGLGGFTIYVDLDDDGEMEILVGCADGELYCVK